MRKSIAMWMVMAALLALSGCNTMKGLGQDIEKGGEAIQKAVK